jgi:hypothetical protein
MTLQEYTLLVAALSFGSLDSCAPCSHRYKHGHEKDLGPKHLAKILRQHLEQEEHQRFVIHLKKFMVLRRCREQERSPEPGERDYDEVRDKHLTEECFTVGDMMLALASTLEEQWKS